jgi:hypothetical protein
LGESEHDSSVEEKEGIKEDDMHLSTRVYGRRNSKSQIIIEMTLILIECHNYIYRGDPKCLASTRQNRKLEALCGVASPEALLRCDLKALPGS